MIIIIIIIVIIACISCVLWVVWCVCVCEVFVWCMCVCGGGGWFESVFYAFPDSVPFSIILGYPSVVGLVLRFDFVFDFSFSGFEIFVRIFAFTIFQ